ncbi:MAG: hypothetical protein AB1650_08530 [Candidatus Omnitrophota bacterium]
MITVGLLIVILLPSLLGTFVLTPFLMGLKINMFLRFSLGSGLGWGIISLWIFLLGAFGLPMNLAAINLPLILIALFLLPFQRRGVSRAGQPRLSSFKTKNISFSDISLASILFCCVVYSLISNLKFVPISSWDGISTIAFKAKFFFYEGTFSFNKDLPHASYPLLVPLVMMWEALNYGQWHEYLTKFVFFNYFLNTLLLVYGFLLHLLDKRWALMGTTLMCFANYFILHSYIVYRDLPLAFYTCSAILLILLWKMNQKDSLLVIAGIFSGLGAFTKLEGMGYCFIEIVLILYLSGIQFNMLKKPGIFKSIGFNILRFLLPVMIILGSYFIFKMAFHVPFGEGGKTEMTIAFDLFLRVPVVAGAFVKNLFGTIYWNWNWYLLAACFLFSFNRLRQMERNLLTAIYLFFLADAALFLLTPNYRYLLVENFDVLLPRLILHFFPLAPILTTLMLNRIFVKER